MLIQQMACQGNRPENGMVQPLKTILRNQKFKP
jgi:hypothetical protein